MMRQYWRDDKLRLAFSTFGKIAIISTIVLLSPQAIGGDWSGEKSARAGNTIVHGKGTVDEALVNGTRSAEERVGDAVKAAISGNSKDAVDILNDGKTRTEKARQDLTDQSAARGVVEANDHLERARERREKQQRDHERCDCHTDSHDPTHTDGGADRGNIA